MNLRDYAMQLADPDERARVLGALDEAETVPVETGSLDAIEARYGSGAGVVDLDAWMAAELQTQHGRGEFESLMHAAWLLRVRLAFRPVDLANGAVFVRIDKVQ